MGGSLRDSTTELAVQCSSSEKRISSVQVKQDSRVGKEERHT